MRDSIVYSFAGCSPSALSGFGTSLLRASLLAVALAPLVALPGCTRCGSELGYSAYRPPPGAWEDVRASLPADQWRRGMSGVITLEDGTGTEGHRECYQINGAELEARRTSREVVVVPCLNLEGPQGTSLADLEDVGWCALEHLPALPAGSLHVSADIVISSSGVDVSLAPGAPRFSGLRSCLNQAARWHRRQHPEPDTIEVGFLLSYDQWCAAPPTGEHPLPGRAAVGVGDLMVTRFFRLHPSSFGWWLQSCQAPDAWQLHVQGDRVEALAYSGVVVSVARRTPRGFTVTDAAGRVVLSATGPRDHLRLSAAGRDLGELSLDAVDGAHLISKQQDLAITGQPGRWRVNNMVRIASDQPPDALLLLELDKLYDFEIELVHRAAAFALLANWKP